MSLYDDIEVNTTNSIVIEPKSTNDDETQSFDPSLLKNHLKLKHANKSSIIKSSVSSVKNNLLKQNMENFQTVYKSETNDGDYNPLKPNEYFSFKEKYYKLTTTTKSFDKMEAIDKNKSTKLDEHNSKTVAIAPPQSLLSDGIVVPANSINLKTKPTQNVGMSFATNIMAKYGWKEGSGLGKQEQGIKTCLRVERTNKKVNKIIDENQTRNNSLTTNKSPFNKSITEIMKNPSKIILLLNMVSKDDLDHSLEEEIKSECAKYGKLINVIIHVIPECSTDENVRVFLHFERIEIAIKAIIELNGRIFDGRTIKALFYDFDLFSKELYDEDPL